MKIKINSLYISSTSESEFVRSKVEVTHDRKNCTKGQMQNTSEDSERFSVAPVQTRGAGIGNKRVRDWRSGMHVKKLATFQGVVQTMRDLIKTRLSCKWNDVTQDSVTFHAKEKWAIKVLSRQFSNTIGTVDTLPDTSAHEQYGWRCIWSSGVLDTRAISLFLMPILVSHEKWIKAR